MPKQSNQFKRPDHYDFTILDESGDVVGHIRIKPSGILWCPKSGQKWYRLTLDEFSQFAEKHGKLQKK